MSWILFSAFVDEKAAVFVDIEESQHGRRASVRGVGDSKEGKRNILVNKRLF
jgi:hypothetical protein